VARATNGSSVQLSWYDNSSNESGFKIYRNSALIATVGPSSTSYQDSNLSPATNYRYSVSAFNGYGESGQVSCSVVTPNPLLRVTLDRIGVYDNRENWLRGDGDVYVLIGVSDGVTSTRFRLPEEPETYKLDKNETEYIGATIFYTPEVGDYLSIAIIGYERDGEGFERFAYQALGMALESYTVGGIGAGLLETYDLSLGDILASFFGAEDDWLGSYERSWNKSSNWGTGTYSDIVCYDERGEACLRLWFTVESR